MDTSLQSSQQRALTPPAADQPPAGSSHHKVYVLSCAHCDSFVSDRGMRAVLLLRPSITLFSTDGMPFNCGPLYPEGTDDSDYAEQIERTCNCLTQSLGCFGCGNTIGYHIICPCSRCVDSVSKHRRSANGHRWVFHYGEVTYKERTYVADEPGVYQPRQTENPILRQTSQTSFLSITDEPEHELSKPEPAHYHLEGNHELIYDSSPSLRSRYPSRSGIHNSTSRDMQLKEGDPVYWHQLVNAGERVLPVFSRSISHTSRPAR